MIATKTLHSFGDKGRDNELILFHQTGLFNFVYFLPLIEEQVLSSHFFFFKSYFASLPALFLKSTSLSQQLRSMLSKIYVGIQHGSL